MEKHTLEIPIEIEKVEGGFVGQILEPEVLKGCIVQGDSIEDTKKELMKSFEFMLKFYEQDHKELHQRAIWLSNFSSHGTGNWQFWFSIIGFGANINYTPIRYFKLLNKKKKEIKYFGRTEQGGWKIGKFLIFFKNNWTWK